jgi:hypothetical protein
LRLGSADSGPTPGRTGDQLSAAYVHGYVKLQVARPDAGRALQVLQAHELGTGEA